VKITKKAVNATDADPARDQLFWDDALPGFGLRVSRGGAKSYVIQYRNNEGRSRRLTLGRHGVLTPEEARGLARQRLVDVVRGGDPAEDRVTDRAEPTLAKFAERYIREYAVPKNKPSSVHTYEKLLDSVILPKLGTRKLRAITRAEVARFHADLVKTPTQANRALEVLSKMFYLAEAWGLRPDLSNPCRHIGRYPERPRRRYLSGEEMARVGAALKGAETAGEITPAHGLLFRLLLFTGCRVSEIVTLKWDYVDFEHGLLMLPDSKTGQRTVVLSAPAYQLLSEVPRAEGNPFVLAAPRRNSQGRRTHIGNQNRAWNKVRDRAKVKDVRIHDLRHTFASVGAGRNLGLPMIGALLGHTQAATTQRYAHLAADPLRQAANLIAGEIAAAMEAKPPAEVIGIDSAGKGA
jgi:integrase